MKARLPKYVSADSLEIFNSQFVEERPKSITIDITAFRKSRFFAEGRLLGILASAKRENIPIYVRVHSPLSRSDPPYHKYWKIFLGSVSGVILAQFATNILGPSSRDYTGLVLERQAFVLNEEKGLIGSGEEVSAPIIDKFGRPSASPLVTENDVRLFTSIFRDLLKHRLGLLRPNELNNICEFAFEIIQNTRDHASSDLRNRPIDGIRFISIRRVNLKEVAIERLIENKKSPISNYLATLKRDLWSHNLPAKQLVEITIADSGVGIPARMAGTTKIYESNFEEEKKCLLNALELSGTSKPSSNPGAGLGLYKVLKATNYLKGLIVFRTGRTWMYNHYVQGNDNMSFLGLSEWSNRPCTLIAGTSISLIFPWVSAGQLSFDLSN